MPPVPVGFEEGAETGSVDETPVDRGTDPVPGADVAEEVPLPYGAEVDEDKPPVPVPVPGRYEEKPHVLLDDDGAQGASTETVTVVGRSLTTSVSVTVVMYWYCLCLIFLGWGLLPS